MATITTSGTAVNQVNLTGTSSNDTINAHDYANATRAGLDGVRQTHVYAGDGDDIINMVFYTGNVFRSHWNTQHREYHGHHVQGGDGEDIFNFQSIGSVTNTVIGRLEDYNPSLDTLQIEGAEVTKSELEVGYGTTSGYDWKVVKWNGDHNDVGSEAQQWLLIDTGQGWIFYSLDGARVDMDGDGEANGGDQEGHFFQNAPPDFATMSAVGYVDPINYVPDGFAPGAGGLLINDTDDSAADTGSNDTIQGSTANDVIAAGLNDDFVYADSGDDTVWGGNGDDSIYGEAGHDVLYGGLGADSLIGAGGDDSIFGGQGAGDLSDSIYGGSGNDTIFGGDGNDELRGDDGNDSVSGDSGADTLIGGNGNDTLSGGSLGDELFGGDGQDYLNGGFGHDQLNGGDDADQFFHLGIADHGSDWIQDYDYAEGDVLQFGGGAATASDFLVQFANTSGAGNPGVSEAFVTHIPSGNLLWALVDGGAQSNITVGVAGTEFDLL